MKQKKRSGLTRIGAMLLVFILAVNLVVPCLAASGVVLDDTKAVETGILKYDYDQIPEYMLEDNLALDALEYIGYDVQALKDNKVLYHPDYVGLHLASSQYLLQEDPILTYIKYSDSGAPGASEKRAETPEELAATQTGWVPDVDRFKYGNSNWKPGMSCTSFVEYFVFGYLKHIVGKDVKYIEQAYNTAHNNIQNKTSKYPDTWTEMCEGTGNLIANGKVKHYSIELEASKDQTAEYNAIWRKISPGTIIRFGNDTSPYIHYAVYIGTHNNLHYVAQVGGGDRGPEIFIAEQMAYRNDGKTSFPIDFYDFNFQNLYGAIQVVKTSATNRTKLAGAKFIAINTTTGKDYTIGPTNENGYALVEGLPYNATAGTKYTVREIVPPEGYALDPTVHTVTLSLDTPLITLDQEIVNTEEYGSLQIQKDTNTGNNKAGWQFNLYKNSPTYTTQLTTDNSGQMFRVTVSDYKGNFVTSDAVSMTTTPLKILKHPQSVKVALGDTAQFNVTVQGDGLSYKWYYQNPGGEVNEATSTAGKYTPYYNYTISNADRSGRAMWCVITDKYGNTVTTEKAYLWLNTDPNAPSKLEAAASLITYGDTAADDAVTVASDTLAITKQPQNHVDEDGTFATFTVEAQGVGLTYVWETSTDGGKTWKRLTNPIKDSPYTTDAQGIVNISDLQTGDYFVQEIDTGKDGWEYDLVAKPVTVTEGHTATAPAVVRFTNNELTGGVLIQKVTEDGNNLDGWLFGIYTDKACTQKVVEYIYTTNGGQLLYDDLTPGTYWVKELGHDDQDIEELYHCGSENPQMVTVESGKTTTVTFENDLDRGNLHIEKYTEDGKNLEGWEFAIYADVDCSILIADELYSDGSGMILYKDLLPGTYWVREEGHRDPAINELYYCASENPQMVSIEANDTDYVMFENELNRGSIEIIKKGNNSELLAGAEFQASCNGNLYDFVEDLENTGHYYLHNVPYGTYTIIETQPPEGYEIGEPGQWEVTLDKNTPNAYEIIEIVNDEILGGLSIKKETEDGKNLAGWLFSIYADADCSILLAENLETDGDGFITYSGLKPGTVWVREEGHVNPDIADLYYCNSNNPQSVEIVGHETATVTFENNLRFGSIEIIKISIEGTPLAGAKFLLEWSEDGSMWEKVTYNTTDHITKGTCTSNGLTDSCLITDSTGIIAFTGLHPQLYYRITELEVPEGYLLLTDYVYTGQLPEDTLKLDFTVVNAKIFELPKTGSTSMTLMPVALLLSTATCVGVLLYLRKKKES